MKIKSILPAVLVFAFVAVMTLQISYVRAQVVGNTPITSPITPPETPGPSETPLASATPEPTVNPTPTAAPTTAPTPTVAPTVAPTETPAPTINPSPTVAPTVNPTPTTAPTETPAPTVHPSLTPNPSPTTTTFNVTGTVNETGFFQRGSLVPDPNATVEAQGFFNGNTQSANTDANGNYSLNLTPGLYLIKPSDPNIIMFAPIFKFVTIKNNNSNVNFTGKFLDSLF